MKKVVSIIVIFSFVFMSFYMSYSEDKPDEIVLNDIKTSFKIVEKIEGMVYVPLVELCEKTGIKLEQNNSTYILKNEKSNRKLEICAGSNKVVINGMINTTIPFVIIYIYREGSVPIVPLSYIVETLGGEVIIGDDEAGNIIINSYKPIIFKDKNLESEIRNMVNKPDGDILKCDVSDMISLILPKKNIEDIEGLQYFTELTQIDLANNNIKDIEPLRQLKNVKSLKLDGNPIGDYSPIASYFDKLEQKDIKDYHYVIWDQGLLAAVKNSLPVMKPIPTFDDLKSIKKLDAHGRNISDLRGIQNLINLEELDLSNNNIKDFDELIKLPKLKELNLSSNAITQVDKLNNLKNLEALYISNNNITDFHPIVDLYDKLLKKDFTLDINIDGNLYKDICGHWAEDVLVKMIKSKIISGYQDNKVKPDAKVTRAEMVVMIAKALNIAPNNSPDLKYIDVDNKHWAAGYIQAICERGIFSGYTDNSFKPDNYLSRSEIIKAVMIAFDFGISIKNDHEYNDKNDIPKWADPYIKKAYEMKISTGYDDNTFRPNLNVSRAEAAAMLSRSLDLKKD